MPLYLNRDLGVRDASQVALWTGLALGGTGLAMALVGPIWGAVGDRFGLKSMVVRALFGGGLAVLLMGLVTTPVQLVGTRVLFGALAGAVTAANALVVAETPTVNVTRALGVMGSGLPLGRSFGPLVGSALVAFFTFRQVFIATGVVLAAATLLVMTGVRETPRQRTGERHHRRPPGEPPCPGGVVRGARPAHHPAAGEEGDQRDRHHPNRLPPDVGQRIEGHLAAVVGGGIAEPVGSEGVRRLVQGGGEEEDQEPGEAKPQRREREMGFGRHAPLS